MDQVTQEQTVFPRGLIVFGIDTLKYCLDIRFVRAILNPRKEKSFRAEFPGNGGVIEHEGREYPLINLCTLFGKREFVADDNSRVIVVENEKYEGGLLVEKVIALISGGLTDEDPITFGRVDAAPDFSGSVELNRQPLWLLDLAKTPIRFSLVGNGIKPDAASAMTQSGLASEGILPTLETEEDLALLNKHGREVGAVLAKLNILTAGRQPSS